MVRGLKITFSFKFGIRCTSWLTKFTHVEVERGLLRNNDLTFSLIKNEYIYTKPKTQK